MGKLPRVYVDDDEDKATAELAEQICEMLQGKDYATAMNAVCVAIAICTKSMLELYPEDTEGLTLEKVQAALAETWDGVEKVSMN